MRLLVCGSRNYSEWGNFQRVLSDMEPKPSVVIHGCCPTGADDMAHLWANANNVPEIPYAADWKTHGRAAGPIRNQHMIEASRPDLVIAFGKGRGTDDCVRRAKKAGIRVRREP